MTDTTTSTNLPAAIGMPFEGGHYAGCICVGEQMFALIAAPKGEGETEGAYLPTYTDVPGACSYFDGMANTVAMAEAGSAIANWARGLQIGGHTDWYIPSRDELEMLYRAFKPTTDTNYGWRSGENPSSVPAGYPYTSTSPAQTPVEAFRADGAEAFDDRWYWSSTQYSANYAWYQYFDDGNQNTFVKAYEGRVRAVRRFLIT